MKIWKCDQFFNNFNYNQKKVFCNFTALPKHGKCNAFLRKMNNQLSLTEKMQRFFTSSINFKVSDRNS